MSHPSGHVNTFTTLQFFTGISRNTLSKSYMLLSVSGISKFMHIIINMPYRFALEVSKGLKSIGSFAAKLGPIVKHLFYFCN